MEPNLRIGHLFSRGWRSFKTRPWLMMGVFVTYTAFSGLLSSARGEAQILGLVWLLVSGPLMAGMYYTGLHVVRGDKARFDMLLAGFRRFFSLVLISMLYYVLSFIGFILLVIPGIIVSIAFAPVFLLALESELSPFECFDISWKLTKGYKFDLFLLAVVTTLFVLLGFLALGVGIILTGAVSVCIYTAAYDELTQNYKTEAA